MPEISVDMPFAGVHDWVHFRQLRDIHPKELGKIDGCQYPAISSENDLPPSQQHQPCQDLCQQRFVNHLQLRDQYGGGSSRTVQRTAIKSIRNPIITGWCSR